jgi:hypothetical protein
VTVYAWRRIRRREWMVAGLGLAGLLSLALPLLFLYGVERSSTRLPATTLWIWLLLGFPLAWFAFKKGAAWLRAGLVAGYAAAVYGGLVILAILLIWLPYPQISYFVDPYDARLAYNYWNRLPAGVQVIDRKPYRAVTLFGRETRSYLDFYHAMPEWSALISAADPGAFAQAGYGYVYMDWKWWGILTPRQRRAFEQPCVQLVAAEEPAPGQFRRLLDISACSPEVAQP